MWGGGLGRLGLQTVASVVGGAASWLLNGSRFLTPNAAEDEGPA